MTRMENLTPQVDGVTDKFSTVAGFDPATLTIGYNGQVYPPGMNIKSTGPAANEFTLEFVPTYDVDADINSKLMVFYEELSDPDTDIVGSANPPLTP